MSKSHQQTAAEIKAALDKDDAAAGMKALGEAVQDPAVMAGLVQHIKDGGR